MAETTDDADKKPSQLDKKKLLVRIRERCTAMIEADRTNRDEAKADIRFVSVPGEQWDAKVKTARGSRPCYEFDKLSIKAQRVINEMRANRPAGKVRAAEDGDKATADVREGLCRNIANVSDLDTICDYAGVYQVEGGMGAWRVTTEYAKNSRKKQRIRAEPIPNPFCLYWDNCSTDPLKRDARDWCLIDTVPKDVYAAKYGKKAKKVSFDAGDCPEDADWDNEEEIRVCEYWYKETVQKKIWVLTDGREVDSTSKAAQSIDPQMIQSAEEVDCDQIMMCIASGDAIIEGPVKQAGTQHRFVVVHGAWKIIDGKPKWWGLVRKAKDAQRRYNVTQTAITETIASSPNSQFWATAKQAAGQTDTWDRALSENLPYLLYNTDPGINGPPIRMQGPQVPAALMAESQIADQELKDVTGVYDAALGERSNEKSGVAISRREQQTQLVNFNFPDNMAKGVQRTWEIFNDLIGEIIDTEQMIRTLGVDGSEEYIKVNTIGMDEQGLPVMVNDMTTGEFDITVTVGPSFATQRQEAAETYTQMAAADPMLMATAGDLVYKSFDYPYAEEMAERRRAMLPPQILELINKDKKLPPEVMQAQQQIKQMQAMVTQQGQMVQAAAAEADKEKGEVGKLIADLNVKRAQFDADVAKSLAQLAQKEAGLVLQEAKLVAGAASEEADTTREQLANDVQNAVSEIGQRSSEFLQAALESLAQIHASSQPQVIMQPQAVRPRIKAIQRGANGTLIPQYEDAPGDSSGAPPPAMNGSGTMNS